MSTIREIIDEHLNRQESILRRCRAEGRENLTIEETKRFDQIDDQIKALREVEADDNRLTSAAQETAKRQRAGVCGRATLAARLPSMRARASPRATVRTVRLSGVVPMMTGLPQWSAPSVSQTMRLRGK